MSLNIKHPEADRLAHELAKQTGETIADAVVNAIRERLTRLQRSEFPPHLKDELLKIGRRCAALPDLDSRSPEEILGYDKHGLPT